MDKIEKRLLKLVLEVFRLVLELFRQLVTYVRRDHSAGNDPL